MNTIPNDYVTQKNLDHMLQQIFDFVKIVNEGTEQRLKQKLSETKKEIVSQIRLEMKMELNRYDEKYAKLLQEIRDETTEIKKTNVELKNMNKNMLGMVSYHKDRISIVEKKAHTHRTDML